MAKSKVKSKPRKRKKSMATTTAKRRTKRRKPSVSRHLSTHHKPHTPKKRRKKRNLFDAAPGMTIQKNLVGNVAGAAGGLVPLAGRAVKMPMWLRVVGGLGLAVTASAMGAHNVGAGISGATAYALGDELVGHKVHEFHDDSDDDMEDTEYVDPDTLSDSGMDDEYGNALLLHEDGRCFAMDEHGELEEIDDAYSLSENMQNVSGINLMDAYALSEPNWMG